MTASVRSIEVHKKLIEFIDQQLITEEEWNADLDEVNGVPYISNQKVADYIASRASIYTMEMSCLYFPGGNGYASKSYKQGFRNRYVFFDEHWNHRFPERDGYEDFTFLCALHIAFLNEGKMDDADFAAAILWHGEIELAEVLGQTLLGIAHFAGLKGARMDDCKRVFVSFIVNYVNNMEPLDSMLSEVFTQLFNETKGKLNEEQRAAG